MAHKYILAIDQGTSGTKTVIFNSDGNIVAKTTAVLNSSYPQPGFVEQDPEEIYLTVLQSVKSCLEQFNGNPDDIVACGISNQRETILIWDEHGNPLCNAVVWQCKRSVDICNRLQAEGLESEIRKRTGLVIDPYFSGSKLIWLLENDNKIRHAVETGKAFCGTIDTWLLFKLTNSERYLTEYTNASRTLFFNIETLDWDHYLLDAFGLAKLHKPEVKPSSYEFGESDFDGLFTKNIPIAAMVGDSHAAAFGEGCFQSGTAKATLGTGSSILLNTEKRVQSTKGMVTTICWSTRERVDYALEGVIVTCGATIRWLQDKLGLFLDSSETEAMARSVDDNNDVYVVPAFSGMGAPYWKMDLKAAILGLTFGSDKNHIVRAALESIPYQIKDVISAMEQDSEIKLQELKADGGISVNRFVMQFLADLLKTNVVNIGIQDVSALGAAYLAGLEVGIFENLQHLKSLNTERTVYRPDLQNKRVSEWYTGWQKAVQQLIR